MIPPLNWIVETVKGVKPTYPNPNENLKYMILFPEDYKKFGKDPDGNLAILVDKENAEEIKRLADEIIEAVE